MNVYTDNGYTVNYDVTLHGGIKIIEVFKGKKNITEKMDILLRAKLINDIWEYENEKREALEWEADQEKLDYLQNIHNDDLHT